MNTSEFVTMQMAKHFTARVYCRAQKPELYVPDLLWHRQTHLDKNLEILRCDYDPTPNGFHDTVLFTEDTTCSKPQK